MIDLIVIGLIILIVMGVIIYPVFTRAPFAYGASRLRAAKSKFLTTKELTQLAYLGYYDILVALEEKKELPLTKLMDKGFEEEYVQKTIVDKYLHNVNRIISYTPKQYVPFFKQLRARETLEFILTVIRSKHFGSHKELMESLYIKNDFITLTQASELSLVELLAYLEQTPYGPIISKHTQEILAGDLSEFEAEINQLYFKRLLSFANDRVLKRYTKVRIDIFNARNALHFNHNKMIQGGSLSNETLNSLGSASSLEEVKSTLENTYMGKQVGDSKDFQDIVRNLWRLQLSLGNELASQQPLSIAMMLSYYLQSKIELKNIRILLKLTHARFAPEEIERCFI